MTTLPITMRQEKYIAFTVLGTPQPQGSMKGFAQKGKVHLISDNKKNSPWRQQVGQTALGERAKNGGHTVWMERHVPVEVQYMFYFSKPKSAPKKRGFPAVKPDIDKLARSMNDALKGVLWVDDGQIVSMSANKFYGLPERAEIRVWVVQE